MKPAITTNEVFACRDILANHPENDYWKMRFDLAHYDFDVDCSVEVDLFLQLMDARQDIINERLALLDYIGTRPESAKVMNGDAYRDAVNKLQTGALKERR